MPNLKTKIISVTNAAGDRLELSFSAAVTDHGEFRLRIPDTLVEDEHFLAAVQRGLVKVGALLRLKAHTYASGREIDGLVTALRAAMVDYITVETRRDLVIVYCADLKCAFWDNPDGSISQNGYTGHKSGKWVQSKAYGDLNATRCVPAYRVGLYAKVWERITHTRGSSVRIKYEHTANPIELNSFIALSIDPELIGKKDYYGNTLQVMPYIPEAAAFFASVLLGLCEMARRVNSVINDGDRLALAINTGAGLIGHTTQGSA